MEEYFNNPRISNSSLKTINLLQGGSPKKFKKYVIDGKGISIESPSLKNGKLIHKYVECPEDFIIDTGVKPSEMMADWVQDAYDVSSVLGDLTNEIILSSKGVRYSNMKDEVKIINKFNEEGLAYYEFLKLKNNKVCLDLPTKFILEGVIESLKNNKEVNKALFVKELDDSVYYNEFPIYWQYKGLELKSLLDRVIINYELKFATIIDLKTTSKALSLFKETFEFYHYHRQLAFYKRALQEFLGIEYAINCKIVAVETIGLFECNVFNVSEKSLQEGDEEWKGLLNQIIKHKEENSWDFSEEFKNTEL